LTGDLAEAHKILDQASGSSEFSVFNWASQLLNERDFVGVIDRLEPMESDNPLIQAFRSTILGWARRMEYGLDAARGDLESAINLFEAILEEAPSNADVRQVLGLNYAQLGDSEAAIREARLAVDLTAKDAFSGPVAVENLAAVYALVDRSDDALKQIERLLAMEYQDSLTVHRLGYEFQWDPLRDDPRFQELIGDNS
ncbi:MAG: tetratricopeptide repeat protein, partial [Thermoanaerobaculia bacterium]